MKTITCLLVCATFASSFSFSQGNDWLWAKGMGSAGMDVGSGVANDLSGNVYTTGHFTGTVDFDPGAATYNLSSAGGYDVFITKFSSTGAFLWAKSMGGPGFDQGYSIAFDPSGTGSVYTTGTHSTTADFDPGAGVFNLITTGTSAIFISKLDVDGNFLWAKTIGSSGNNGGNDIVTDASGNSFTTGYFEWTTDFDPGAGTFSLSPNSASKDVFIVKLNSTGNFVWAKNMGGSSTDIVQSIALDAAGNIYTTGYFSGNADFDPGSGTTSLYSAGSNDVFISKLDVSGNFAWVRQIGAAGLETGYCIASDGCCNVYVTGLYAGTTDFDPGPGVFNLNNAGNYDIFILKLNVSGNFVWVKSMGGLNSDIGRSILVAPTPGKEIFTAGSFGATVDFDPGAGNFNLTSAAPPDIFISKLDSSGNFLWAKAMGGANADDALSISADASGTVSMTGTYNSASVSFDSYTITNGGSYDIYTSKLTGCMLPYSSISAAGSPNICSGSSVTLNAYVGIGSSYQWRLNGGSIPGATAASYAAISAGSYDCMVSNGCGSVASNAIAVTTSMLPTASITAAGPTTMCIPGYVTLNAATGAGWSYQWGLSSGGIFPGATSSSYNVATTTSGNYRCTVSNVCGSVASNTITITIEHAPDAFISGASNPGVCAGGSWVFSTNTAAGYSYQWRMNGAIIAGATNYSFTATAAATYNCITSNSCGSDTSNTVSLTVTQPPAATISAQSATTFCTPNSVTLNASLTGVAFQWRNNGIAIPGASSATYVATTGGNYDCIITNSCGSVTSNSITVTVFSALPVAVLTASGPVTFCTPGNVTLSANSGTGLVYQWVRNGIVIPGATSTSYMVSTGGSYACQVGNSCGVTNSNIIIVTVIAAPAAPGIIAGSVTGVCASLKTYSINAVPDATGYTWAPPPGATVTTGQGTLSAGITFTGTFGSGLVSVVAVNSCGSSAASSLSVSGAPAQPGTITGPVSVCHNQNNVIYSVAGVTSAASYTWTVPPGTIIKTGQGTRTIKVRFGSTAGNIIVKANNSCGSSPVRSLAVVMPCREADGGLTADVLSVNVFPNPSLHDFTFSVVTQSNSAYSVRIVDLAGRTVEIYTDIPANTNLVCGEKLSRGIYLAEIISGNERTILKLIRE
jgi:hypothetical protein